MDDHNIIACIEQNLEKLDHIIDLIENLYEIDLLTDHEVYADLQSRINILHDSQLKAKYAAEIRRLTKLHDQL